MYRATVRQLTAVAVLHGLLAFCSSWATTLALQEEADAFKAGVSILRDTFVRCFVFFGA